MGEKCLTLAVLLLLLNGCSYAFVQPAPTRAYTRPEQVKCTRHYAHPILDTGIVGAAVYVAEAGFTDDTDRGGAEILPVFAGVAAVMAAVPFVLSAVYGYVMVTDCGSSADAVERLARDEDVGQETRTRPAADPGAHTPVVAPDRPAKPKEAVAEPTQSAMGPLSPTAMEPDGMTRAPSGNSEAQIDDDAMIRAPSGNSASPAESAAEEVPMPDEDP